MYSNFVRHRVHWRGSAWSYKMRRRVDDYSIMHPKVCCFSSFESVQKSFKNFPFPQSFHFQSPYKQFVCIVISLVFLRQIPTLKVVEPCMLQDVCNLRPDIGMILE